MAHLAPDLAVSSAGTANWHVGSEMDPRARAALDRAGFTGPGSPAQWATPSWIDAQDLIVVMTREQQWDVRTRGSGLAEVVLLRALVGEDGVDLPDPYYGDDDEFDACLALISRSCRELARDSRAPRGTRSEA